MGSDQTVVQSSWSHCSVVLVGHVGVLEKIQAVTLHAVYEVPLFAVRQLLDCGPLYVEEMFQMVAANFLIMRSLFECATLLVTPQVAALDVEYEVPLLA